MTSDVSEVISCMQASYLQVLRQFLTPSVARVHGDEEADSRVQTDQTAISEHKLLLALTNGAQDTVYLQSDDYSFQSNVKYKCALC